MMETSILSLAAASLRNRLGSATLTILAVALSVTLFLGVEKSRTAMRTSFDNTISGTELIVGAPTGATNLLLHAVFHIGTPQAELSWSRYQEIAARPDIAWAAPVILGDSHRGFDVLATNQTYFDHYKFGRDRSLELASGEIMTDIFDAVVGASVAAELGYDIGTPLILSHGIESTGHAHHDDRPFRIVGILKPTGTPVDRTVHIGLEGLTAMHVGWETGSRHHLADSITTEMIRSFDLTPDSVSAVFIGLKDKTTILQTRRALNSQREEPVTAIIPGQTLTQLWRLVGTFERLLIGVSIFVIAVGMTSILTSMLSSLNERRREMSVLRAVGAGPRHILMLLVSECGLLGLIGASAGVCFTQILILVINPVMVSTVGMELAGTAPGLTDFLTVVSVSVLALIIGFWPAWTATRNSIGDGLAIKL